MSQDLPSEAERTTREGQRVFFTWSAQREAVPLEIVGGSGARFRTADGAEWLDMGSMTWNANLGHQHPAMRHALTEAASRSLLVTPSSIFPEKLRAAERLLAVAPRGLADGKVFFCLSGAEANENAVKIARLYTGRRKIVYRSRSYHGATLGMLSLSGDPRRQPFDPGLPDGVPWEDPYSATPCQGDLETVLLREGPESVAAVLLEGVVGANGVYVPPPGYFRRIRQLCDRFDVLFVADEVLSGFGRTGRWFAVDHDGVSPDILTCAKALTGGYAPGGALVVSGRVAHHFDENVLSCGLTAYAHPLTCTAVAAALDAYRNEDLVPRAERLGRWLQVRLRTFAERYAFVRDVRGLGLLWALELEPGKDGPTQRAREKALGEGLRRRHLHLHKRDNMVFLAPPLVTTEADLEEALVRLGEALGEAWGLSGGKT
jgi:taurine---2-oxoglutarate transaminase